MLIRGIEVGEASGRRNGEAIRAGVITRSGYWEDTAANGWVEVFIEHPGLHITTCPEPWMV